MTSEASVAAAAAQVHETYGRVDVVVNNAGIVSAHPPGLAALRDTLATNVLGAAAVTEAFRELLVAGAARGGGDGARLVFVGSSMGSLAHSANPDSPYYRSKIGREFSEYRVSKAAVNMMMIQYGKTLKEHGVRVWCADPGLNATNLIAGAKDAAVKLDIPGPEVGGELVASVVKGGRDADVGRVVGRYGVQEW